MRQRGLGGVSVVTGSPDCREGKHRACLGDAWDDATDAPATCDCACHSTAAAELAAAQRELDAACEETGATIGCIRAPGGATPAALRAIAQLVRQSAREEESKPTATIRVIDGDILGMTADAIVNPWNRNYWPRKLLAPGGLSGKLKERTTEEPWRQLAKLGMLPTGEVVVTDAGGLAGYRHMFHAIGLTFGWKATVDGVTECARNIVRQAIARDVRSITVPLIGAGTGKLAPAASEAAILAGLADVAAVVADGESADVDVTIVRYQAAQ